ncbi:Gluconokinase (EC 2.7.1.12) CDS [Salmonella enterica subsp. enterica serovar Derby]|nr:Gluconokinase (EC 2.7.1.12) CDS [Salmonella enterica subsp. enterica serovar Derby]
MAGESYILMGVSGSGKSLIGSKIATLFSAMFIDGDDLHPSKNIDKMSQGIPLTDEIRWTQQSRAHHGTVRNVTNQRGYPARSRRQSPLSCSPKS